MAVNWPTGVNSDFFDLNTSAKDNLIKLEFESGKTRTYLKNSSVKRQFSVSFYLWTRTEEALFWCWYDNKCLSGSQPFYLVDFVDNSTVTTYKMTSVPTISDSQYPKVCTIEVEEE